MSANSVGSRLIFTKVSTQQAVGRETERVGSEGQGLEIGSLRLKASRFTKDTQDKTRREEERKSAVRAPNTLRGLGPKPLNRVFVPELLEFRVTGYYRCI